MIMKAHVLLILSLTLFACQKDRNKTTLEGKWKLTKYHNLTDGTSESEPAEISRSIVLSFSDNGSEGVMEGHTVSNEVNGKYELSVEKKMKTNSFGGTKVGEPNWGSNFWDAIRAANAYDRKRNKLFIFYNSGTEKMEFEKQ
jgi:hypothetical protein